MPTYTRIAQATAELRYIREPLTHWINDPQIYTAFANTGNACFYLTGVGCRVGMGFEIGSHTRGGLYIRYPGTPLGSYDTCLFFLDAEHDSDQPQHFIAIDQANQTLVFSVDNSQSTVAWGDVGFTENAWHRIGWDFNPDGWLTFYLNDTLVFNSVGAVTYGDIHSVWAGTASSFVSYINLYVDDFWADLVTGASGAVTPPNRIFMVSTVEGPGTYDEWTPYGAASNWQCIDDPSTPDGDSTHNYTSLTAKTDTFVMSDVTIPETGSATAYWKINAVIPQVVARRPNVAENSLLRCAVYDGMNMGLGTSHANLGPDYLVFWHRFTTEPDNSLWSEKDLAEMEIGYKSAGTFT